ncbi:hypothetical protein [Hyalangium rubrum]|uniref:Uncharacterized protein n=1 Tax=Hyalangium rubrum TaxID=3103134 RepID=A0ABU5HE86_9BACT|nr:hypothetical protein [Hyalangium sp. s54d21]MDY7231585.1 hypothetical protein [Hyalangium sp. s54d21]
MKSFVAVFDCAPLGVLPWMEAAAKAGGLTLVQQDDVGKWLSEDPEFRKAIMAPNIKSFSNPDPSLTPYYLKVLETKVPEPKVALHGWGWLVFAEKVDLCILDYAGLEQQRKKSVEGVAQKKMDDEFFKVKSYLFAEAKKRLPADRILQLQGFSSEKEKQELAVQFVQKLSR